MFTVAVSKRGNNNIRISIAVAVMRNHSRNYALKSNEWAKF